MAKARTEKPGKTKRAATAAVTNPGSLAGIGGAVAAIGAGFDPGNAETWAQVGGAVSILATLAASFWGARGQRSGS